MKILYNGQPNLVRLGDIPCGDVFIRHSNTYVKVARPGEKEGGCGAVNLVSGKYVGFYQTEKVEHKPDSVLTVK